jgi:hypothetical protein
MTAAGVIEVILTRTTGLGIEQLGIKFTLCGLKNTRAKQVAKALYASSPRGVPSKNQSRRVERT